MFANGITRRRFLAALPAAALVTRRAFGAPAVQRAFIGTTGRNSDGIHTASFDPATGSFTDPQPAATIMNTDFLAVSPKSHRYLYSTCLVDGVSAVTAFEIGSGNAPLRQISQQTAKGTNTVYLAFDRTGRVLMDANWGSGVINTYLVAADGTISPAVEHIEYGDANHGPLPQQPHSRAHSIVPSLDNKFVLENDLGDDCIRVYRLDAATGKLTPNDPPMWKAPAGTGPRHIVLHPNGKWVYSDNEMGNSVDFLLWDGKGGTLKQQATVPMLPEGHARSSAADLIPSPDFRFLYGSNRGVDSIVVWSVGKDGTLTQVQSATGVGAQNRQMCIDATGKWLIASNTGSGNVQVFPRDVKTGMLGEMKSSIKLAGACFTLFA